jgi:hypothetical protein
VNDIIIDPNIAGRLYVGTDVGVFYTDSLGVHWDYLGTSLPNAPVTDLVLHNPTRTLIAATYGRSIYSIDLSGITETKEELTSVKGFVLYQNYPNPFNPVTSIQYVVSITQFVILKVYDILGNEIATLVNEEKQPGIYEVKFTVGQSASADSPDISSGIYFYQLKAGNFIETKKMTLLR